MPKNQGPEITFKVASQAILILLRVKFRVRIEGSFAFFSSLKKRRGDFININPIIESAFSDFEVNKKHLPIAFLSYTGNADSYLTYYTWQEQPANFFDDEHHAKVAYGTIDIFSKGNFKDVLKEVKKVLKKNNFTWTNNGPETFDREIGYYHVPVNFCACSR